jgi:hypothetical protein
VGAIMKSLNQENDFVFKIVSRFAKIKEAFTVKLKMISVNHYFRPHQTLKNAEIIF